MLFSSRVYFIYNVNGVFIEAPYNPMKQSLLPQKRLYLLAVMF